MTAGEVQMTLHMARASYRLTKHVSCGEVKHGSLGDRGLVRNAAAVASVVSLG